MYLDFGNDIVDERYERKTLGKFTFRGCTFKEIQTIQLYTFEELHFYDCTFMDKVDFADCHFQKLEFQNCVFEFRVSLDRASFINKAFFIHSTFKDSASFRHCECEQEADFLESTFMQKVDFSQTRFQDFANFTHVVFNDYADFSQCEFEKTANFYGATFKKSPNFSQTQFKGSLNLVNTNLEFNFKNVKYRIHRTYVSQNKDKNNKKPLVPVANDFRDSFRTFKSALIKDNNNLDASNHHKYELYCKEIELDSKKPKTFSKEWIDSMVLKFYRHTSDHHTDLLKSFHSLLLVVGIFGLLSYIVIAGFACCYGGVWYSDPHALTEFYNLHIKHFILTHFWVYVLNLVVVFLFFAIYLITILCQSKIVQLFRLGSIFISYLITFTILIISPKHIIPAIGIFTDKRSILDPLSTIGAIYTILFALMLYSFIKTARKNSIVPS